MAGTGSSVEFLVKHIWKEMPISMWMRLDLFLLLLSVSKHSLPPGRVEPTSQTDVVADVNGVDLDSAVQSLKQVLHLKRD